MSVKSDFDATDARQFKVFGWFLCGLTVMTFVFGWSAPGLALAAFLGAMWYGALDKPEPRPVSETVLAPTPVPEGRGEKMTSPLGVGLGIAGLFALMALVALFV